MSFKRYQNYGSLLSKLLNGSNVSRQHIKVASKAAELKL